MDYSVGEVHIFDYNNSKTEEIEIFSFLDNYHNKQGGSFKSSQIEWMIVDLKQSHSLPLNIH